MFYLLFIPSFFASILMIVYLKNIKKHDIVLYKICQVRRDSMQLLRNNWQGMSKEDYLALRKLLDILNSTINSYNEHKIVLFNLRRFFEHVKRYDSFSKEIEPTEMPKNGEIQALYTATFKSLLYGFFAYTPLIKSEIFVKISFLILSLITLLGIEKFNNSIHQLVESITNAREQAHDLGVHC